MIRDRQDWSAGDHFSWVAVDAGVGNLLGSVSLHDINHAQGNAEIGYWTAPAARSQGIATNAVATVCRWAFISVRLHRIVLYHAVENQASARIARKAGFTLEGKLRRSYRYGDGIRHDELLWARLYDDPPPKLSYQ